MAPTTQLLRISELEATATQHEVKLAVLEESHKRLREDVEELRQSQADTKQAFEEQMKAHGAELTGIKVTLAAWSVGAAIIVGIGATIGGWLIKSSLDSFKNAISHNQPTK